MKEKQPRMNGKMLTPTFFKLLYSAYKKLGQFFFYTLLANLFNRDTSSCYKYFNKLISEV